MNWRTRFWLWRHERHGSVHVTPAANGWSWYSCGWPCHEWHLRTRGYGSSVDGEVRLPFSLAMDRYLWAYSRRSGAAFPQVSGGVQP